MKWTDIELLKSKELLESGKTYEDISKLLNRQANNIRSVLLRKFNIKWSDFNTSYVTKNCLECNNKFTVTKSSDNKYNHKFCSHSCSAIHTNKNRILSDKTKIQISKTLGGTGVLKGTHCLYCNTKLSKTAHKYCNIICKFNYENAEIIKQWLAGKITGHVKGGSYKLRRPIKHWLFDRANHKCEECGNNDVNPYTNNSILQVDHTDGDASNSIPSNLKVLCPNCHAKTKTFGNIGGTKSARFMYKQKYRQY